MDPLDEVEAALQRRSDELTAPDASECLYCYLRRMLDEFGCTNDHRFTQRWALGRRVRGRPVLRWAQETGGCCCDCEVVMNSFGRRSSRRRGLLCDDARLALEERDREGAGLPAVAVPDAVTTPDDRRRDAVVELLRRIRAAPGGRGLDTNEL